VRARILALGSAIRRGSDPSAQDIATPTPSVCTLGPAARHASPKFTLTVFSQIIISMPNAYECKDNPTLSLQSL